MPQPPKPGRPTNAPPFQQPRPVPAAPPIGKPAPYHERAFPEKRK